MIISYFSTEIRSSSYNQLKDEDVHLRLQEITNNAGPDVVVEAVGSDITYQTAVKEVAYGTSGLYRLCKNKYRV